MKRLMAEDAFMTAEFDTTVEICACRGYAGGERVPVINSRRFGNLCMMSRVKIDGLYN